MKNSMHKFFLLVLLLALPQVSLAQDLLQDTNGDELISVLGFGDSITFGFGDGVPPGSSGDVPQTDGSLGYLQRISQNVGIATENRGDPGEEFIEDGIDRLPGVLRSTSADVIMLLVGTNDAGKRRSADVFSSKVQRAINIIKAFGKTPVLLTLPTPCCDHDGFGLFTRTYSQVLRGRASINEIAFADIELAWDTSCRNPSECEFYNLPEGLHPNSLGYDIMGYVTSASLLGINPFTPEGIAELESALGLEPGTIPLVPLPTVAEEESQ